MLLSDVAPSSDPELRRLRTEQTTTQQLIQEIATQTATSPITNPVSRGIERTLGVDSFRITPSLGNLSAQSSRLEPAARFVLGKRLGSRGYLTYARSLSSSTRDEIITVEFDQTDRFSWILSRNEDQTYAFELRVRHEIR